MKLDKIDNKLLSYLYYNYREPITVIAKKCRISRDQAEYRISKYESEGLIKKYLSIFNYSALGYNEFVILYLKIDSPEVFIKNMLADKNVISMGKVLTNYNLYVNLVFKNRIDFNKYFDNLLNTYDSLIKSYDVFFSSYLEFYPLKKFGINSVEKQEDTLENVEDIRLDDKDFLLLKELEKNGRTKIVELSGKTGLSSELIIYKIRQYHKKKLLLGSRIQFDMEKLGYYFATIQLKIKNPYKLKNKILELSKRHLHINAVVIGVSDYNCLIQIMYNDEKDLRKTLRDINQNLSESILSSNLIFIEQETSAKTLP